MADARPPLSPQAQHVVNSLVENGFDFVFGVEVSLGVRLLPPFDESYGFAAFVRQDGVSSIRLYKRTLAEGIVNHLLPNGEEYVFYKVSDLAPFVVALELVKKPPFPPFENIYERTKAAVGLVFKHFEDDMQIQQDGGGGGTEIAELRTLCNQRGISCRDRNGKFLTKSQLIRKLK